MFLLLLGSAVYPFSAAARATPTAATSASVVYASATEEPNLGTARDIAATEAAGDVLTVATGDEASALTASSTPALVTGDEATSDVPAPTAPVAPGAESFGLPVAAGASSAPDVDGPTDDVPAIIAAEAPGRDGAAAARQPKTAGDPAPEVWPAVTASDAPVTDAADLDSASDQASSADASPAAPSLLERVSQYRVAAGESLTSIAARFGLSVDTLRWANTLPGDPDLLFVGKKLTVLPVDGVLYVALPSDTLQSVATAAHISAGALAEANGLSEGATLEIGQHLLVPGGRPLATALPTPSVQWPRVGTGTASQQQFIQTAVPLARDAQRETGVPASVTVAQAILESDWGASLLTRAANNFFGIKATGNPAAGDVYWSDTWEVLDGADVVVRAAFQAYTTPRDSFLDHGRFFLRNRRYAAALRVTSDPRQFAQAIADAGYATDPAYAGKLIRLMDQYQLYQYDLPAAVDSNAPLSAPATASDSPKVTAAGATTASDGALDCHCWMVPVRPPAGTTAPTTEPAS